LSLAVEASRRALADAGVEATGIDTIAVVRTNEDSTPFGHPNGKNENLPGTVAREIGATPERAIYTGLGGQCPQQMVNELAARIHDGEIKCALLTGSEANRASKGARRHKVEIDWADSADLPFEDRVDKDRLLNQTEIKHGLVFPPTFYGFFENAIAARDGETRSEHRASMSRLWEKFSAVAADNPNAQFRTARSAEFLATPSKENFEVSDPFLKWHVAQDSVNVGAAALLMSEEMADALGVPAGKRVYLHGGGEAADTLISERASMDSSWAMETAIGRALDQAGKTADDIDVFDLYSCFPCAVFSSIAVLGIDPDTDKRQLTVTGGLPFFGGPGNNYSLHGIASITERLREAPGDFGLVLANGGWMTKEAAGVYSTTRPDSFTPAEPMNKDAPRIEVADTTDSGTLESFTIFRDCDGNWDGVAFVRTADGKRVLANSNPEALQRLQEETSPVGLAVSVEAQDNGTNRFTFA
ncbi:MAG: acetyl-CoA acetyltransferase, partial [Pseudomonadota bacterium]